MIESYAYSATYASLSYTTKTTALSFSLQQNQSDGDGNDDSGSSDDDYSFSLGYTTTTTVETYSLLVVQESRDFSSTGDKLAGGEEKSALASVLQGPKDPFEGQDAESFIQQTAADVIKDAVDSFYSIYQNDDKSDKSQANKFGHTVRDNNAGHTKEAAVASYSAFQVELSTTSTEISLSI